jgi:hypothetical protein
MVYAIASPSRVSCSLPFGVLKVSGSASACVVFDLEQRTILALHAIFAASIRIYENM